MLSDSLNQIRSEPASSQQPIQDIKIDSADLQKNNDELKELEARLNTLASCATLQANVADQSNEMEAEHQIAIEKLKEEYEEKLQSVMADAAAELQKVKASAE